MASNANSIEISPVDDLRPAPDGPCDPSPPDALRAALRELVRLKDFKTRSGETPGYRAARDRAWAEARRVLGLDRSVFRKG